MMKNFTLTFLFFFIFLFSCTPKGQFQGEITFQWNDNRSRQEDEAVIIARLKKLGIEKYTIRIIDNQIIQVQLKNLKDTTRLIELMNYNEELGFWECYENTEAFTFLNELDTKLSTGAVLVDQDEANAEQTDSASTAQRRLMSPLWSRLQVAIYIDEKGQQILAPGAPVGHAHPKDTAEIDSILKIGYGLCLPKDMVLRWTMKIRENDSLCTLIALKKYPDTGGSFMNQSSINSSQMDKDYNNRECLIIRFDEEGAKFWEKMTKKNTGRSIVITLGGQVVSYPRVESAIKGGIVSISGPNPEEFKIIEMGTKMLPFKTSPVIIDHHFEKRK